MYDMSTFYIFFLLGQNRTYFMNEIKIQKSNTILLWELGALKHKRFFFLLYAYGMVNVITEKQTTLNQSD